jgi:hypothetical protein
MVKRSTFDDALSAWETTNVISPIIRQKPITTKVKPIRKVVCNSSILVTRESNFSESEMAGSFCVYISKRIRVRRVLEDAPLAVPNPVLLRGLDAL